MSERVRTVGPRTGFAVLVAAVAVGVGVMLLAPPLFGWLTRAPSEARRANPEWIVTGFAQREGHYPWSSVLQPVDGGKVLVGRPSGNIVELAQSPDPTSAAAAHRLPTRIMDLAVSDDGRTVAAIDLDGNVAVWKGSVELASGKLDSLTFSSVGLDSLGTRFAAVGFSVRVWSLPDVTLRSSATRPVGPGGTSSYQVSRFVGPRLLLTDIEGTADAWAVDRRSPLLEAERCNCREVSAAWSRDGALVAFGTGDGRIVTWDVTTNRVITDQTVDAGEGSFAGVHAVLDRQHILFSSSRTKLGIWNVDTRRTAWVSPVRGSVDQVALSPDERTVAVLESKPSSAKREVWTGQIRHQH